MESTTGFRWVLSWHGMMEPPAFSSADVCERVGRYPSSISDTAEFYVDDCIAVYCAARIPSPSTADTLESIREEFQACTEPQNIWYLRSTVRRLLDYLTEREKE